MIFNRIRYISSPDDTIRYITMLNSQNRAQNIYDVPLVAIFSLAVLCRQEVGRKLRRLITSKHTPGALT